MRWRRQATVTGSITAADIQAISTAGPTDQGVAAGEIRGQVLSQD